MHASKGNAHPGRADEMGIFSARAKTGSAIARHNGNVSEHYSRRVPLGSQTIPKPTATQFLLLPTLDSQKSSGGFKNCWSVEECFDKAKPSNLSDCDSGPERLTHHLPGAVRPRFARIEALERPKRPTQTCGKHEGSLSELADSNCVDPAGLLLLRSIRFQGLTTPACHVSALRA